MTEVEKRVLSRLQSQCARMEYCSADIMRKALKALDGDRQAAERVVASLVEEHFVDDRRYASAYARDKSALSGWGPRKISCMLSAKGIDDQVITEALDSIEEAPALARLEKALSLKCRSLGEDPALRSRLLRFSLSRGYGYDTAVEAVDKILQARKQFNSHE